MGKGIAPKSYEKYRLNKKGGYERSFDTHKEWYDDFTPEQTLN